MQYVEHLCSILHDFNWRFLCFSRASCCFYYYCCCFYGYYDGWQCYRYFTPVTLHYSAVAVIVGEVNMWDYWKLISCWFTPDLRLNNCRPSVYLPTDRLRRAHIKDVAVVEPRAALSRRKVWATDAGKSYQSVLMPRRRRRSWVNRISGLDSRGQRRNWSLSDVTGRPQTLTYRSRHRTAHLSVTSVNRYERPHATHTAYFLITKSLSFRQSRSQVAERTALSSVVSSIFTAPAVMLAQY